MQNLSNQNSPFGVHMPGRSFSSGSYRYGFQGQEKNDEIKGEGNSINYKYRVHDPRLGRFLSVDPLAPDYPWNSPYAFSENRVIDAVELEGAEKYDFRLKFNSQSRSSLTLVKESEIVETGITGYTFLPKENSMLVPVYGDIINAIQEYTVNGISLPIRTVNKLIIPMSHEEMTNVLDNEIDIVQKKIENNNSRILEIGNRFKELDMKMMENNKNMGDPDPGEPKLGNTFAKNFKNAPLVKEWFELIAEGIELNIENNELKDSIENLELLKETIDQESN
jgi:RHS repeat-associated protein